MERVLRRLRGRRDRHVVLVRAAPRCGLGGGGGWVGGWGCGWGAPDRGAWGLLVGSGSPADGGLGWRPWSMGRRLAVVKERVPASPDGPRCNGCATPSGVRTGAGGTPAGGRGSRYGAASVPLAGGWCQQAPGAHPGPHVVSLQPQPRPCSAPLRPTCSARCPPLSPTPLPGASPHPSPRPSQYPKARPVPVTVARRLGGGGWDGAARLPATSQQGPGASRPRRRTRGLTCRAGFSRNCAHAPPLAPNIPEVPCAHPSPHPPPHPCPHPLPRSTAGCPAPSTFRKTCSSP
jgi:hypothetical protein